MKTVEDVIEATARPFAKAVLSMPSLPPATSEAAAPLWAMVEQMIRTELANFAIDGAILAPSITARAKALVAKVEADPAILLKPEYFDLVPDEVRAKMRKGLFHHFPELAAAARFTDDGEMVFPADAVAEALAMDRDEVAEAGVAMPAGKLHQRQ